MLSRYIKRQRWIYLFCRRKLENLSSFSILCLKSRVTFSFFFSFYLEEFYNQFSLRIISKLFWRGTITWIISVYRMFDSTSYCFKFFLIWRTIDESLIPIYETMFTRFYSLATVVKKNLERGLACSSNATRTPIPRCTLARYLSQLVSLMQIILR